MHEPTIGFLGGGKMAQALVSGLISTGRVQPEKLSFHDPNADVVNLWADKWPDVVALSNNREVMQRSRVAFLAVKPQVAGAVVDEIGQTLSPEHLVISIVAGWPLDVLCRSLATQRVVRVMPNTPCLVGAGASCFACGPGIADSERHWVREMFASVGTVHEVNESQMDAVTGLSGSGPAYVFTFMRALADGGVLMGLPRDVASQLAAQTVLGAATLARETGEHPSQLIDQVASPAGTTMHGLAALERRGFRAAVIDAVRAASERSAALSPEKGP